MVLKAPPLESKLFSGSELEGLKAQHPFYDKQVPVILGDHVTTEAGTGAVHTAPAHGQEDLRCWFEIQFTS